MTFPAARRNISPITMMHAIHAIYENGTFRPLAAVNLPEATEVIVTPLAPAAFPNPADEPWENRRGEWLAELDALRAGQQMPPPGAFLVEQILDDDRGD